MALLNKFPYSNAHELNLDWILELLKLFPRTVNNTQPDENGNINLPTVAGMSSWNGIGADGSGNVNPEEVLADLNDPEVGFHIYHWENPDTLSNPYSAAENHGYMTGNGGGMCFSCRARNTTTQIAVNMGDNTLAVRVKPAEDQPWSEWSYIITEERNVSQNVTLGIPSCINQYAPHVTNVYISGKSVLVYVQGVARYAADNADHIAGGLPLPKDTDNAHLLGMVIDSDTGATFPCKVRVNADGDLIFDYGGGPTHAGDTLVIKGEYIWA